MTKTENLSLNLFQPHDPSADAAEALNANALAVDDELHALSGALADGLSGLGAELDALSAAVAAGGNCKIAYLTYTGNGQYGQAKPTCLTTGFRPLLMVIYRPSSSSFDIFLRGCASQSISGSICSFTWGDSGVQMVCTQNAGGQYNEQGQGYYCTLVGVDA